ncbi:DUF6082 family protein [Streptomyces sp. NPDC093252]|uniref:DUF6082 family protein n=1 Tax=Streptomyces sp. NPDC093252 TaxID=3154980 RepID=UPI003447AAFB
MIDRTTPRHPYQGIRAGFPEAGATSISGWLVSGVEEANGGRQTAMERGTIGDCLGGVSAVFSGLALILLAVTLLFQQRELRMQARWRGDGAGNSLSNGQN